MTIIDGSDGNNIADVSYFERNPKNYNLIRLLAVDSFGTAHEDNDVPISGSGKISYKSFNKKKIVTRMYLIPNNCTWSGKRDDFINDQKDYWDARGEFHVYAYQYLSVAWTVYRFKLDNDSKNDMVIARGISYNDYGYDGPWECQKQKRGSEESIINCRSLGDYRWLVMLPVSMSEAPHPNGSTYYDMKHLSKSPISMGLTHSSYNRGINGNDYYEMDKDQYRAGYYVSASFRCAESWASNKQDQMQGPLVVDWCTRTFDYIWRSGQSVSSDQFAGMINWYSPTDRSFCITTDAGRDNVLNSAIDFLVIGETADLDGKSNDK